MTAIRIGRREPEQPAEFRSSRRLPSATLHMGGLTLMFVAGGMAVSVVAGYVEGGSVHLAMVLSVVATGLPGMIAWRISRVPPKLAPIRVFGAVTASWLLMVVFGALPYVFAGVFEHLDDALFESVSGYTCTGSSIIIDVEGLDKDIAFYRMLTQWVGGMGVIVLAVAVLPFLGIGGLELIDAEAPGPTTDRLSPRVSETAKRLWAVYLLLTAAIAIALMATGTGWFDGICYAFTLAATGGFAMHTSGVGHFDSMPIELIFIAGMLLGGMSFTLHYRALHGEVSAYWRSEEWRAYIGIIVVASAAIVSVNTFNGMSMTDALRSGPFNVVSVLSTTGVGNLQGEVFGNFVLWASAAQFILLALMLCGAMTGSTSGGPKVLRLAMMGKIVRREVRRAGQPRAVIPLRHDGSAVRESIVDRIIGFCLLYFLLAIGGVLVVSALSGTSSMTDISGTLSALGNAGQGLGEAGPSTTFLVFSRPARMVLAFLMLAGRLDLFALLLGLLAPFSWLRERR